MNAWVATRYGGPEVLALIAREPPPVGPKDVRIAVKAASLNPIDFKIRSGKARLALPLRPPIGLGCDVAGVIESIGPDVTRFRVGDGVYARLEKMRMGGLAELVSADEKVVSAKPVQVSFAHAAAIPLAGLTALQALREAARLQPGQHVLIHAGAGGVGSLAIQIAKHLGLSVTTTTSSRNRDFVRTLGADHVIDYTQGEPLPQGLDAVFDTLGGRSELASLAAVRRGGTVVGVSGLPDAAFAREWLPGWIRPALWLMTTRRRRVAARAGARFVYLFMRPDGMQLQELAQWIDAGRLRPILHRIYPFEQTPEAFAELERGHSRGKIVVAVQPDAA